MPLNLMAFPFDDFWENQNMPTPHAARSARGRLLALALALAPFPPAEPAVAQTAPTTRPATATASAQDPLENIVDFDLEAYVASLNPPTVEELIALLEPIPTLEEVLASLDQPAPPRPELPEEVAEQVAELEKRIHDLRKAGLSGDDQQAQDAALAEAIRLAEQVLALRLEHQSEWTNPRAEPAEWYEVGDARRDITHLRKLVALTTPQRSELARAERLRTEEKTLHREGKYAAAARLRRAQLLTQRRVLGESSPEVALSLANLAYLLREAGTSDAAFLLYRTAFQRDRDLLGEHHPDVATVANNLGMFLLSEGDDARAEVFLGKALALRVELFGGLNLAVERSLNNLATLRSARGDYTGAEELFRVSLNTTRRLVGNVHPAVAVRLTNLGLVLEAKGEFAEAECVIREALALHRTLFDDNHPAMGRALANLAGVLKSRGSIDEAEELNREALAVARHVFPGDHPQVANSLNNLAAAVSARGRLAEAELLYRTALAMQQRLHHHDHPAVACALNNLAYVLQGRGALSEAELLYRDALAMWQRIHPQGHPDVATAIGNLSQTLRVRGKQAEAERFCREALVMCQRFHQGDHPEVAVALNNVAQSLKDRRAYAEAEPLLRDALAMSRRLYPHDHPRVANGLNILGVALDVLGDSAAAESLYRDALAMRQRLFADDHPEVVLDLGNLAGRLDARGALAEAEPLYRQAFEMSERLRTQVIGGEQERAAFAEELLLSRRAHAYASALTRLSRGDQALGILERGRGRAALDLLERRGRDLVAEARSRGDAERAERLDRALDEEDGARIALNEAEHLLAGRRRERTAWEKRTDLPAEDHTRRLAEYDQQIAALEDDVKRKRQALSMAGATVLTELRGLHPAASPLGTEELLRRAAADEAVLCFSWTPKSVLVAVAAAGESSADLLVADREAVRQLGEQAHQLRAALSAPPATGETADPALARDLAATLLPAALQVRIAGARRLIVLPDGPLSGIPFEVLAAADPNSALADKAIAYAPSATVYVRQKADHTTVAGGGRRAVVLGNPLFERVAPTRDEPRQGVLLAVVREGSNAGQAGLQRGDVLVRYAGRELKAREDLGPAITAVNAEVERGDRPPDQRDVPVEVWRDGKTIELALAPGKMGVASSPAPPAEGLRSMALLDQITRGGGEFAAGVSATDQVRLFGGELAPLPGTAREARALSALCKRAGVKATLLTAADASVPALRAAVSGKGCRYLHLATHGLMGSADRPLDASLALAQPQEPTPDDIGFLRLEDLVSRWGGRLAGCELVVLSACDTQRGERRGDTVMSLPLGFFFAGARTVVASLWKVDDTATALLMMRFYENLLGEYDEPRSLRGQSHRPSRMMTKLDALDEAKHWLRQLTAGQVRALCKVHDLPEPASAARGQPGRLTRPDDTDRPFEHPYYWASFILMGDPE